MGTSSPAPAIPIAAPADSLPAGLPQVLDAVWSALARGVQDRWTPWALPMLATVGSRGQPEARVIALRGADREARTLTFHTDARSGKVAALAIVCYLTGTDASKEFAGHRIGAASSFSFQHFMDPKTYPSDLTKIVPYEKVNTLCFPHGARRENPDTVGIKGFQEVLGGLDKATMAAEIYRCFKCGTCTGCDLCFLLCPDLSLVKEKKGYSVRVDYCKGCSICSTSCPRNVIEVGGGI